MERHYSKEIKILDRLINNVITEDNFFKENSLNRTQIQILIYIARNQDKEICQKDLELETGLKKASITGTLDCLEEKKIIERKPSKYDKRKNIIIFTSSTAKAEERIKNIILDLDKELENYIDENSYKVFFEVIDAIKKNLEI